MYDKPAVGCFWLKAVCDIHRISWILYCKRVIPQLGPLDIMKNETSSKYVSLILLSHGQESLDCPGWDVLHGYFSFYDKKS